MVAAMDCCHGIAMVAAMVADMVADMVAAMGLLWLLPWGWIAVMGLLWIAAMDCCYGLLPWTGHVGLAQKSAGNVVV